jgi:hypothetical protein
MWLRFSFTFHPTVLSALVTYLPTAVFAEYIEKLFDSFNSVKCSEQGKYEDKELDLP